MSLTIQLTDEQAAPFIAALEKLANPIITVTPAPLTALPSEPEAIPADKEPEPFVFDWSKVPEGFDHPAMDANGRWAAFKQLPDKDHEEWGPNVMGLGIAYQIFDHPPFPGDWKDSLHVRPKTDNPEPVKRREWTVSIYRENGQAYPYSNADDLQFWEPGIRVREVLPGDPTPEQVEALARLSEELRDYIDAQKWGSAWPGKPHATIDALEAALAPFQKH